MWKRVLFSVITLLVTLSLMFSIVVVVFLIELKLAWKQSLGGAHRPTWLMLRPYGLWSTFHSEGHHAQGYRFDDAVPLEKAPTQFRIAVLGGSAVYGHGVTAAEAIPAQMEQRFQQLGKASVQVLNFGIPGYTSTNELITLALRVIRYDPDVVIVYDGWNDMLVRHYIPHYNGYIEMYKEVLNSGNRGVSNLSVSINNALLSTRIGTALFHFFSLGKAHEDVIHEDFWMLPSVIKEATDKFERQEVRAKGAYSTDTYCTNLKTIDGILRAYGIKRLFVFQPYNEGHPEVLLEYDEAYPKFEETFLRPCVGRDTPFYSFVPLFQAVPARAEFFSDSVHGSAMGNRVLAAVLADLVRKDADASTGPAGRVTFGRIRIGVLNADSSKNGISYTLKNVGNRTLRNP